MANIQSVDMACQICLQNISQMHLYLFSLFHYLAPKQHYLFRDLLMGLFTSISILQIILHKAAGMIF